MKSIERTFETIQKRNPGWGSYIVFAETVKQTQPNYRILRLWFNKLVDKSEYAADEKTQLFTHLKSLITPPTMYKKQYQYVLVDGKKRRVYE